MFLDEAIIDVRAGSGGPGVVGWRREKYVPNGGPDGGDGGHGGSVFLVADANTDTLSDFLSRKRFEAESGRAGSGSRKGGRDGEDLFLKVPPGTVVTVLSDGGASSVLADLKINGEQVLVAHGGRGGFGNAHFATSVRQAPDFAELGEPGMRLQVKLELKLIAEVGIIGFPSVGKSTLISVISAAKPMIAAYPFTTLVPNLGVVTIHDRSFVVSDLPGLIEGASAGKGLGFAFLKHIERCGTLLHMLDISRALQVGNVVSIEALVADYRTIRTELQRYSPVLAEKRELIILNKIDLVPEQVAAMEAALQKEGLPIFQCISAVSSLHIAPLLQKLLPIVLEERELRAVREQEKMIKNEENLPVLRPQETSTKMGAYRVTADPDHTVRVKGLRIEQFAAMTNFGNESALDRFRHVLKVIGLQRAISRIRTAGAPVYIGKTRVDEYVEGGGR